MPPPAAPTRSEVFREPSFGPYLVSRFASGIAHSLLPAAIGWHVYALSHSAFFLGLVGIAGFLPSLVFSLLGGALADAYDRRRVAILAQWVSLSGSLGLFAATWSGVIGLPGIFAAVVLVAASSAFEHPARMAMLPQLVRREIFPRAVTVNSSVTSFARLTGPALMGFVAAAAGIAFAYALHAALLLVSIASLAAVRLRFAAGERRPVDWQSVLEGLRFVRANQVVLGCMTVDMFAVIFGGAQALLPVYATDILHVGEIGYGILYASLEAGALTMALILVVLPTVVRAGRALLLGVAAYGLATITFGLSELFVLSAAAYLAVGMADQVSVVLRATVIQLATPDALRGRVSSVNLLFINASNQLGAAESGFVAALTGSPVFAVVSGGVGCLLVVAAVAWRLPALLHYRVGDVCENAAATPGRRAP